MEALLNAPVTDEPETGEERAAVDAAKASSANQPARNSNASHWRVRFSLDAARGELVVLHVSSRRDAYRC
jgi:hypothetical protein